MSPTLYFATGVLCLLIVMVVAKRFVPKGVATFRDRLRSNPSDMFPAAMVMMLCIIGWPAFPMAAAMFAGAWIMQRVAFGIADFFTPDIDTEETPE